VLFNPFKLKSRAEVLAAREGYAAIPDGRRDALRHLIGSALFTRSYGALLAWFVGETMEFASWLVRHNSADQRDMDRHNNAIGREIAREAASEEEVVALARVALEREQARWLVEDESFPDG